MKRKNGRSKKSLRQQCLRLSLAGMAGIAGLAAIKYRQNVRSWANLRKLKAVSQKNNSLMRPIEELQRESKLIAAVTKAGWPIKQAAVVGLDNTSPFVLIKLPLSEYAKLSGTTDDTFILQTFIDTTGKHHSHDLLPKELRMQNLSYQEFERSIDKTRTTRNDAKSAVPA